jgi:hypothetical protein
VRCSTAAAALLFLPATSCNEKKPPVPSEAAATSFSPISADAQPPVVTNPPPPLSAAPADAGPTLCKVAYGPTDQPFRGPVALDVTTTEVRLLANDQGKPRIHAVPLAVRGTPTRGLTPPSATRFPPCEIAGRFAYCQAPGGAIVRTSLANGESKTIAKSRAGTRIAAARIGTDHAVVAFLDLRRTTEGDMLQAFAVIDDGEPFRVSDDGAGATTLRFLARRDAPVLLYLDARSAMVPVHARPIAVDNGKPRLGADTIVSVGGAPERGIDLAVAPAGPRGFALVPMPRDSMQFGLAAIAIDDPPKDDVSIVWSSYPNGLDPAPIAATASRDGPAWVARVRPSSSEPRAPRLLELGRVRSDGVFTAAAEIRMGAITDVALAEDTNGAVWIAFVDEAATWLTRVVCSVAT